jgi:hypothetical protein
MSADFEKQLQRQPFRELPRDWRAEILSAARPRPSRSTWPSPRAWAVLAGAWILIFLLNLTTPGQTRVAGHSPATSFQSFALLHEQTLRLAESFGQADVYPTPAATPIPPKPRSEINRRQMIG